MHLGLEKKVVLITGGTKGIGRSMVKAFLEEGATVHFCSRTKADVDSANANLAKDFPSAKAIGAVVDITQTSQLTSWVDQCAKESSRIDVIVANVSSLSIENGLENWQAAFQADVLGTYSMVEAALPHLEKTKGNIVTISSVSARELDFSSQGPYGALKAALIHYTSGLARRLAPQGIRANTCSPGNIYIADGVWGGVEKSMPDLFKAQFEANPMGRMGKPEEIADAVLFLASERASFVSGANFVVDGALTKAVPI